LDADQRRLVEEHLWLAARLARELGWLAPKTIDGDVLQPAREGLIKAVTHYRPELGKPLEAYAPRWITGAIFNAVDRCHPGFTRPHRVAKAVLDDGDEEEEGSAEGAGEPLDHAAAAMCICSISLRWAAGQQDEKARRLGEELVSFSTGDRAMLLGHLLEGQTWETIAGEAGVSVRTAQRRVRSLVALLVARLRPVTT
jgi:RNA polymerase sigma factor (sigma-70 family)